MRRFTLKFKKQQNLVEFSQRKHKMPKEINK